MGGNPLEFLTEALKIAECPVIVVPENFEYPMTNLFAYDGSESSMFAIKQFAYILPQLTKIHTVVLHLGDDEEKTLPHQKNLMELLQQLFPDLRLLHLNINPKRDFNSWVQQKSACLLIAGSYSRSEISLLFKKSFMREILAEHKLPVFIAHK